MRVTVDEDRCCGAGTCVLLEPAVFDQRDDDGVVVLREPRPAAELWPTVREAATVCPAGAIALTGSD
ncbi:ferredoxin [Streptomyces sp. NPDC096310]|uniref:ferredoxin n=1 Tax=Streptomyces sp. NPDC096310 TaxID=3366082 RepID=UPI00382B0A28